MIPMLIPAVRQILFSEKTKKLVDISGERGIVYDAAGGTLTNGRSSIDEFINADGYLERASTGEITFSGCERVKNLIPAPENLSDASWANNLNITITSGISDPLGGTSAFTITANLANGQLQTQDLGLVSGVDIANCSVWMKRRTGTGVIKLNNLGGATFTGGDVYVDSAWRLIHNPFTLGTISGSGRFGILIETSGDAIDIWHPMFSNVLSKAYRITPNYLPSVNYYSNYPYNSYTGIHCWGDSLIGQGTVFKVKTLAKQWYGEMYDGGVGGETSTQIKTRFLADTNQSTRVQLIWAGRNNYNDPTTVKSDIAAMVAQIPHDRYVILSVINASGENIGGANYNTIIALNNDLASLYPGHYIDVRSTLVAAYNSGIPQDVTDHNNDVPPSSLRSDAIHLNDSGNIVVMRQVIDFMYSAGMMDNSSVKTATPKIIHAPALTNIFLRNRNIYAIGVSGSGGGNSGSKWFYDGTHGNPFVNNTQTNIDGGSTAAKLTFNSAGSYSLYTEFTGLTAGASMVFWFYAKLDTASNLCVVLWNSVSWNTGAKKEFTSSDGLNTSTFVKISLSITVPSNGIIRVNLGRHSATLGQQTAGSVIVGYFNLISGSTPHTNISTDAAQVTKSTDSIALPYSLDNNFSQNRGILLLKIKMNSANSASNKSLFALNTGATDMVYDNGSGGIALADGTNTATAAVGGWAVNDVLLIAACWDSKTSRMSIHVSKNNGSWVDSSDTSYDGGFSAGSNIVFCSGNSDSIEIKSNKIFKTNKSFSAMQRWIKSRAVVEV